MLFRRKAGKKAKSAVKKSAKARRSMASEKPKAALDELQLLIGLTEAKRVIKQASDFARVRKICEARGIKHKPVSFHMIFTGNPGTAKTTVARLTAKILKESGFLSVGDLIEVGRGDLVGQYVGWTAQQVQEKFKEAKGSVLFIDEAYSLVDDKDGSFGDEAINTIVQEMENHREDTVVIFAGYKKPMENLLACNEGLDSRITFRINFPDYTEDELVSILRSVVRENGRQLSVEACQVAREIIREDMRQPNFGNGRYVRRLVEHAFLVQASRLMSRPEDEISSHDLRFLSAEDFLELRKNKSERVVSAPAIGFAG